MEALGAIALGSLIFSFVYWSFGFLRMTTTGFVAQADGAGEENAVRLCLGRALCLGATFGIGLLLLQAPIHGAAFWLLDGSAEVEAQAQVYFQYRIWGAPAALATYAITGTLIGLERSRMLLALQVLINGLNIALDVYLAGYLGLGVRGIALGTAVAEWVGLLAGGAMLWLLFKGRAATRLDWKELFDTEALRGLFGAQLDILIRTLFLLAGFAWFTNQGARFGDTTLAANHVLLQLVSFSAFVLDGFAFATESLVGRAQGQKDRGLFDRAANMGAGRNLRDAPIDECGLGWWGGRPRPHRFGRGSPSLGPILALRGCVYLAFRGRLPVGRHLYRYHSNQSHEKRQYRFLRRISRPFTYPHPVLSEPGTVGKLRRLCRVESGLPGGSDARLAGDHW